MNRLTYKQKWNDYFTDEEHQYNTKDDYAIDKLGKLEDLEEELGCPLEVVFKALKDGIKDKKDFYYDYAKLHKSKKGYRLEAEEGGFCQIDGDEYPKEYKYFYLKDYKRTWWLKGEKDEKED